MKRYKIPAVAISTAIALAAIGAYAVHATRGRAVATAPEPLPPPACASFPYDPQQTHRLVVFHANQVMIDPQNALEYGFLSNAYLQRCRETGDIGDAIRAEKAARHSLNIRVKANYGGGDALGRALFAQHRFDEALDVAERTLKAQPNDPGAAYLKAEDLIERGDSDQGRQILISLPDSDKNPQGEALWARLEEFAGRPQQALVYLRRAEHQMDLSTETTRENVAWFHMRVGNMQSMMGDATGAWTSYNEAVAINPHDYRTMTFMARLAAGQKRWADAQSWAQRSADIVPTPETLALLGDACHAQGNDGQARQEYALIDTVGKLMRAQGTVYDRMQAMYDADHNVHLDEGLALARRELKIRHDVYAYDTLAWAAYKKRLYPEANAAMQRALAQGTRDAMLDYHAGMIALAMGDRNTARTRLNTALATNPYFLPFEPDQARATLKTL